MLGADAFGPPDTIIVRDSHPSPVARYRGRPHYRIWNTASTSPGEELMTCMTSAVAASRDSASSRSAVRFGLPPQLGYDLPEINLRVVGHRLSYRGHHRRRCPSAS